MFLRTINSNKYLVLNYPTLGGIRNPRPGLGYSLVSLAGFEKKIVVFNFLYVINEKQKLNFGHFLR